MKHLTTTKLTALSLAALLVMTSGAAHAASTPITNHDPVIPCDLWHIVDGSTFESVGTGEPTFINPELGRPSIPLYRNCGSHYQFLFLNPPLDTEPSHASVIQPFTTSSTALGPRRLTTWNTERPDAIGLRETRESWSVRGMKRPNATHFVIGLNCSTETPFLFTNTPTDTGSRKGSPNVRR